MNTSQSSSRYARFTDEELDAGLAWVRGQGADALSARTSFEGGWVKVDMREMPPSVRQMTRDLFTAIDLMTLAQVHRFLVADFTECIQLVDHVLTEAGR